MCKRDEGKRGAMSSDWRCSLRSLESVGRRKLATCCQGDKRRQRQVRAAGRRVVKVVCWRGRLQKTDRLNIYRSGLLVHRATFGLDGVSPVQVLASLSRRGDGAHGDGRGLRLSVSFCYGPLDQITKIETLNSGQRSENSPVGPMSILNPSVQVVLN